MSKITNNNGDLRKAFFGNAEVNKIYLGNTELYSKAAPVGPVILPGDYQGHPDLSVLESLTINIPFTTDIPAVSCKRIVFDLDGLQTIISYVTDDNRELIAYDDNGWSSGYEQVHITANATVTEAEYEAFFEVYQLSNLSNTTWLFDEIPEFKLIEEEGYVGFEFDFISNNANYNMIFLSAVMPLDYVVNYENYQQSTETKVFENYAWISQSYRTISITGGYDTGNSDAISIMHRIATRIS